MGNLFDCFDYPLEEVNEKRDVRACAARWICNLPKLKKAQLMLETMNGNKIMMAKASWIWSDNDVATLANDPSTAEHMRLIAKTPFADMDRILDNLFLTGAGGVTNEKLEVHNITVIVNATYEMPLLNNEYVFSLRVPVDDDPDEDLYPYFHEITDFIFRASVEGFRTVVHCLAGASRSTTIVLAYLVKHIKLPLKESFEYVHAGRPCARPNMSFWQQLIRFEKEVHGVNSVKMRDYIFEGVRVVRVPDIYKHAFPQLFEAERRNQLRKSYDGRSSNELTRKA